MDYKKKLFINKELSDEDLDYAREALSKMDLIDYLKDSFVYVTVDEEGGVQIVSAKDEYVYLVSKEYYIDNKMSMEYLKRRYEINNKLKETLYWMGLNNLKKFIPVISDNGIEKKYSEKAVYAENAPEAVNIMDNMDEHDYMYLEDVDGEI